jgi:hypothetical protein
MKKAYSTPDIEILLIDSANILTLSDTPSTDDYWSKDY